MTDSARQRRFVILTLAAALAFSVACRRETLDANRSNVATLARDASASAPVSASPTPTPEISPSPIPAPTNSAAESSPTPTPAAPPQTQPEPSAQTESNAVLLPADSLLIPVVGVRSEDLQNTFDAARSEGRVHNAIDIMAPRGATVVAATDGKIVKFFDSVKGGITIYQFGRDEKTIYYYAHLDRRADNLREGDFAKRGTVIGYVGDTGNSGAGNYHLHFAIWTVTDPKRYWDGDNINPYPLLKQSVQPTK